MSRILRHAFLFCVALPCVVHAASVRLAWDYTQGTETQATTFAIYKQAACAGAFMPLASVPVGTLTYTDTAVVPGTTTCWHVTAKAVTGEESTPSNVVSFRVPIPPPLAPTTLRGTILP